MDLTQLISQVGFPIAVATYSLVVLNKTIKSNTIAINALCVKMGCSDLISKEDETK